MNENLREDLALFRFSLIAPLVRGTTEKSIKEYLEEVCAKTYDVPGLGLREFSPSTLKHWLTDYRRHGLEGLKREPRSDRGTFRSLSPEAQQFITESLKASPKRSAVNIYQDLLTTKLPDLPSLSTVQRFIRQNRNSLVEPEIERRRYECEFANDCWQSDVCVGPYLLLNGKKKKTYLIAFLDDARRLIVHSQFFFEENYQALEETFRQALLKRGIPKKLFVDNGKIYQSRQLRLICARLGIALSFTRPYSPASKGKIERYFRTWRQQFLTPLQSEQITSLQQLNQLNTAYAENTYNHRPHSALGELTPMQRFLQDKDKLQFLSPAQIEAAFLHQVKRRVTKDATVSIERVVFEVPQIYCGQQVDILFQPRDLTWAYLKHPHTDKPIRIEPIRTVDNSKIPRKQNRPEPIDYTQLYQGGN
ncbi:MAG: DDE-type integrase/transposase/recombinase [Peptococcaceae bacterium]|nr:DDE-type integrase/transposase/recombinase [Peptococcaceae bacterium]